MTPALLAFAVAHSLFMGPLSRQSIEARPDFREKSWKIDAAVQMTERYMPGTAETEAGFYACANAVDNLGINHNTQGEDGPDFTACRAAFTADWAIAKAQPEPIKILDIVSQDRFCPPFLRDKAVAAAIPCKVMSASERKGWALLEKISKL